MQTPTGHQCTFAPGQFGVNSLQLHVVYTPAAPDGGHVADIPLPL